MIRRSFTEVVNYENSHGQVSFGLPHDKRALGLILIVLEGLKEDVVEEEKSASDAGG
jgi:hypothetical protein